MFKDTPDGQTNYCTHKTSNPSGICDTCLGKDDQLGYFSKTKEKQCNMKGDCPYCRNSLLKSEDRQNWKDQYPLNTFTGKTKEELELFISALLKKCNCGEVDITDIRNIQHECSPSTSPYKEKRDWEDEFDKNFTVGNDFIDTGAQYACKELIHRSHSTLLQSVAKDLLEMAIYRFEYSEKMVSVEDIISYFKNKHGLDI